MAELKIAEPGFYARELVSEECQCGRTKKRGMSFCYTCWKLLPRDIQRALYARIGNGYEEAYEEAVQCLTE